MKGNAPERLVSGSDDFSMILWEPMVSRQPKTRMTGHQQVLISAVSYFLCLFVLRLYLKMETCLAFLVGFPPLQRIICLDLENNRDTSVTTLFPFSSTK